MKKTDIHVHTHFDDGSKDMTVENIVSRTRDMGLESIGIVFHFHRVAPKEGYRLKYVLLRPKECPVNLGELTSKVKNVRSDIECKIGIETEFIDADGNLNVGEDIMKQVDFVIASCHWLPEEIIPFEYTSLIRKNREEAIRYYNSEAWNRCLESMDRRKIIEKYFGMYEKSLVKSPGLILGHPCFAELVTYRIVNDLNSVREHMVSLAERIVETDSFFNLTEPMARMIKNPERDVNLPEKFWKSVSEWISVCKGKGVKFLPGSDAHSLGEVGRVEGCYEMINAGH